jgi:Uma2 family endonuclease
MTGEHTAGGPPLAAAYLKKLPPSRPFGLVFGILRPPPPSLCPGDTALVPRLVAALASALPRDAEIRAPADVVLDEEHGLVLHPSLAVILPPHGRRLRPDGSVWGAPDLVVELAWPAVSRRLRCIKLTWYHKYGVRECWFVNPSRNRIEVMPLAIMAISRGSITSIVPYLFSGTRPVASPLLPDVTVSPVELFHGLTTRGWSTTTRQPLEATFSEDEESSSES